MTPDPAPALRLRSPGLRQALVVLVLSVLATVGAALDGQPVAAPLLAVLTLLVVGLVAQVAVAEARATADRRPPTADGLTACSPWHRPRRLTWTQIDRVEVRGFWRGLGVWATDGRWVALMPYAAFEPQAYRAVERLEQFRGSQQLGPDV